MSKKIKINELYLNGEKHEIFETKLEGIVTKILKTTDNESIFKLKTEEDEEVINVPFMIHSEILHHSKILYVEIEKYIKDGKEIIDYTWSTDGYDPVIRYYNETITSYLIKVLDGKFKGIEYYKVKSKRNYED